MLHSPLFAFLGRMHALFVHFPIALMIGAALVELVSLIRKKPLCGGAAMAMEIGAFIGALVAAPMGWLNAANSKHPGAEQLVEFHRWAGVAVLGLSFIVLLIAMTIRKRAASNLREKRRGNQTGLKIIYGILLVTAAVGVGITAHWGGEIVYGEGYFQWIQPDFDE